MKHPKSIVGGSPNLRLAADDVWELTFRRPGVGFLVIPRRDLAGQGEIG
jgi:hypothetical protein